jgi:PAS domain-containing protein
VERERVEAEIIPSLHESGSWRGTAVSRRQNKTTFPQDLSLTVAAAGGIVRVVRDITDRKTRERRLCDARRFNEESAENTPFGMFRPDGELRIAYENPRAEKIVGLPGDQKPSDAMGADISDLPPIVETGQAELFETLRHGETIEFEFPFELIYRKEACFTGHTVPIYREGEFDGAILTATDISERTQNERNLKRQREQLAALDELNDVVRGITEAVIEQSTRDEIERVVCERPADSDLYRFAWMGVIDPGPRSEPHVEAGVDGYTDDLPFTGRPGDPEPVGDDECLMYGTASDEAMKPITALRERRSANGARRGRGFTRSTTGTARCGSNNDSPIRRWRPSSPTTAGASTAGGSRTGCTARRSGFRPGQTSSWRGRDGRISRRSSLASRPVSPSRNLPQTCTGRLRPDVSTTGVERSRSPSITSTCRCWPPPAPSRATPTI